MKYEDEVPRISTIQMSKRRQYGSDIDSLIQKYEGALSRSKRQEVELKRLRSDLATARRSNVSLGTNLKSEAKNAADLSRKIAKLRKSRSYRLGHKILGPARALARLWRGATPKLRNVLNQFLTIRRSTAFNATETVLIGLPEPVEAGRDQARVIPELVEELSLQQVTEKEHETRRQEFEKSPSRGSALRLIMHDYYSMGSIERPALTILKHNDLLSGCSKKDRRILDMILGQHELLAHAPTIPDRQPNAVYVTEPGRVLYCAHSTAKYNSNGYSIRTAGIVGGLRDRGEDVVVMARPGYPWDVKVDVPKPASKRFSENIGGVEHVFNAGLNWSSEPLARYLIESTDVFVREITRQRPSIVHSASNYVTALPALIAARRLGVPFTYEVRGIWEITELSDRPWWGETDRFRLAQQLESLVAREADSVLAITEQVRDELVGRGVVADRIALLPNAVDVGIYAPMPADQSLRKRLGILPQSTVLGYTGSVVPYEGLFVLLDAVKTLLMAGQDVKLVVVGDGSALPALKARSEALGIDSVVVYTGRVPSEQVARYLSIFDIMPCPRLQSPVTEMVAPLKPLESMACGKAVILSDLGPLRELAGQSGDRALLAVPGSSASLAEAIQKLIDDPESARKMGLRARRWTVTSRTWTSVTSTAVAAHTRDLSVKPVVPSVRALDQLTVAVIADGFTTAGLSLETNVMAVHSGHWRQQFDESPIDALFVESTWEGAESSWRRQVGYYSDEEIMTLKSVIEYCRERQIPTIFWNKEDPVHFNRFVKTAGFFDHVFTTDANCIPNYLSSRENTDQTVSSLSFYAQPKLHNILPSRRPYHHSVNYAGSFYGERFAARSKELQKLLGAAQPHGLTIYDRQYLLAGSPYQFPSELASYVQGGLDYSEMVEAYKSHPVHINVNSVAESPTMFSRRVAEIAASGGAIVSGRGQGVSETFAGLIPVVENYADAQLLMTEWMQNEVTRLGDAWHSYRMTHRAHLAGQRLAYVLRVAGLSVLAPAAPEYAVYLPVVTDELAIALGNQSVPPVVIFSGSSTLLAGDHLKIQVVENQSAAMKTAVERGIQWLGLVAKDLPDRTLFEDMLSTLTFGNWHCVSTSDQELQVKGLGLAIYAEAPEGAARILATSGVPGQSLLLRRPVVAPAQPALPAPGSAGVKQTILVAGHDLKFISPFITYMESEGHEVLIDKWTDHNKHDQEQSSRLLARADIVICEWALGAAVWYSNHKRQNQRLLIRFHSQELFLPFAAMINYDAVEQVIFVGKHVANIAIRDQGVPLNKAVIIPNFVSNSLFQIAKQEDARFNIGLVGIIPAQKHLDKALDVLRSLRIDDARYRLFIKGKLPSDYPWMSNRPDEMKYYNEQFDRIKLDPLLAEAVIFDGYGDDMQSWYEKIGFVLSVSDFESFHLTLADGAASGAVPVTLPWPGADMIYPVGWIQADVASIADYIQQCNETAEVWLDCAAIAREYVRQKFLDTQVLRRLMSTVL